MCKKNNPRVIDRCLRKLIDNLNYYLCEDEVEVIACCCGHGKYPMSIIVREEVYVNGRHVDYIVKDWISDKVIPRKKRFYRKDKQGYYYIPEVINERSNKDR